MSKKNKHQANNLEELKQDRQNMLYPFVFGLILFVLGVWGIFDNASHVNDYLNSNEKISVQGQVIGIENRTRNNSTQIKDIRTEITVKYNVNNKDYTDKKIVNRKAKIGESVKLSVYKTSKGTYEIPRITSKTDLFFENIIPIMGIVVGGIILLIGVIGFVWYTQDIKKLKEKIVRSKALNEGDEQ